jgi:DNA-directed RNA polymerase subunit M/transcription elongation factor TFIIS
MRDESGEPYDDVYKATIQVMAGHCPNCKTDFALHLVGLFTEDEPEPLETWYECPICGFTEQE